MRLHSVLAVLFVFAVSPAFGYLAFDTVAELKAESFACFKKVFYSAGIFRLYGPDNDGSVDEVGLNNIKLGVSAKTHQIEAYIEPSPSGTKTAIKQYNEAMKALHKANILATRIWLKITSPYLWGRLQNQSTIVEFIADFIEEGRINGVKVGIYTNWYDWSEITHNSTQIEPSLLWYWQVSGPTLRGQADANFLDYRQFAAMPTKPTIKQYIQGIQTCDVTINRNGYEYLSDDLGLSFVTDGVAEAQILRNNLASIKNEFSAELSSEVEDENAISPAANIFDVNGFMVESEIKCLKRAGYAVGAFQVYNRGEVNRYLKNIEYALGAGLNVELTVDPQVNGSITAVDQYNTIVKALTDARYRVRRLWLRVTNPFQWGKRSQEENTKFIKDFIQAADAEDIYVGIYTNWYDWQQITGNTDSVSPHSLWYWQVSPNGRSSGTFDDYVEFGGLPRPLIKQFIFNHAACYARFNVDLSLIGVKEAQNSKNFLPFGEGVSMLN